MTEQDHFSNVLDVEAHEEPLEPHFGDVHAGMMADDEPTRAHEPQRPPKKPIPKALLLVGGMIAFVVVGAGYQHFFGAHPQNVAPTEMPTSGAADTGEPPLPSGTAITQQAQGGMLSHGATPPPLPSQMPAQAPEPIGPVPVQQSNRDAFANATMGAPAGASSPVQSASFGDGPSRNGVASAMTTAALPGATFGNAAAPSSAMPGAAQTGMLEAGSSVPATVDASAALNAASAPDPKDVEIAKLQAEVDALQRRDRLSGSASGALHESARRVAKHGIHGARIAKEHPGGADSANSFPSARVSADPDGANGTNATQTVAAQAAPGAGASVSAKPRAHAGGRHAARYARHHAHAAAEILVGYSIKQVVPGQGWVEDEQSGRQQVVAVGDFIGTAKVVRIDPDNYRIVTTAGVIQ